MEAVRRRSPHGERGLKFTLLSRLLGRHGRSPHGERGLKLLSLALLAPSAASLPTRGAWIEILQRETIKPPSRSRSPHGERGLKSDIPGCISTGNDVAPHTGSVD